VGARYSGVRSTPGAACGGTGSGTPFSTVPGRTLYRVGGCCSTMGGLQPLGMASQADSLWHVGSGGHAVVEWCLVPTGEQLPLHFFLGVWFGRHLLVFVCRCIGGSVTPSRTSLAQPCGSRWTSVGGVVPFLLAWAKPSMGRGRLPNLSYINILTINIY